ncbi:MAG: bL17 family ribosomal protein [Planctomycetota bacterium]
MRHRRMSRVLGRCPSHRKALLKNLASALFLTERPQDELDANTPKVSGRIITTLPKAKEVRPLVEKCITIARRGLAHAEAAVALGTTAERNSDAWKQWRNSTQWRQWAAARAPYVAARRQCVQLLGDKHAVKVLFEQVAPKFTTRPGGYTRIVQLATPRLGDAGARAILEFVGKNDRKAKRSEKPSFGDSATEAPATTAAE